MAESELSKALNGEGALSQSPSSRSPSLSLQAAATLNAGLQRESPSRGSPNSPLSPPRRQSPNADRRRSQVLMNLQIADPSVPSPGEMVSESSNNTGSSSHQCSTPHTVSPSPRLLASGGPHHHHNRTPSLGELHQELENEQEFQVNRLLAQIRQLQEQVQRQQQQLGTSGGSAVDETPISSSTPAGYSVVPTPSSSSSLPRSPGFPRHPRGSFDMARGVGPGTEGFRLRSRTPSRHASPRLRPSSIGSGAGVGVGISDTAAGGDQFMLSGRDEAAFYQAETASLMRENQMLKHRIQVLEQQLSALQGGNSPLPHEPSQSSNLNRSVSVSETDSSAKAEAASGSGSGSGSGSASQPSTAKAD